jgi:probable rRNA maturation factor
MRFSLVGKDYIGNNYFEEVAQAAFSVLGQKEGEIELIFVNEAKIQELNKLYRKINQVTDVLSFKIEEKPFLGQIFICYTKAKEQAKEYKVSLKNELTKLFVHGVLHLYDYDHESDEDYNRMKDMEKVILERINK